MLPAVVDVLQLVVDLRLLGLVAGGDELFSELLQVGFILTEEVDLLHAVLVEAEGTSASVIQIIQIYNQPVTNIRHTERLHNKYKVLRIKSGNILNFVCSILKLTFDSNFVPESQNTQIKVPKLEKGFEPPTGQ